MKQSIKLVISFETQPVLVDKGLLTEKQYRQVMRDYLEIVKDKIIKQYAGRKSITIKTIKRAN